MTRVKKRIYIVCISIFLAVLALVYPFFWIGERVALGFERWVPEYEMLDISQILQKTTLTSEDYEILYAQTGLTKLGIDDLLLLDDGVEQILYIQECFFKDYQITDDNFAIFSHFYEIKGIYPLAPLKNGDIIISASTDFSWWNMGHCAMVVNAEDCEIIEINGFGDFSEETYVFSISKRGNYMILRPNIDEATVNDIVEYTKSELLDLPYDATIGVLSRKYNEEITATQCAHIFWYAFYKFGYDIDSNGGTVVTPQNVSNSQYFDLVQVQGFDPYELWKD